LRWAAIVSQLGLSEKNVITAAVFFDIERRQQARAIDERALEQRTVIEEREALARSSELGEPLDVS